MISKDKLDYLHKSVPVDYYERGIQHNLLQRYWHGTRFALVSQKIGELGIEGNILDLGCHSGDLTNVVQQASGLPVYGVDISEKSITYAKKRFSNINFSCVDFPSDSSFGDDFFGAVTCFDVMEHLPDLEGVLGEIKRIVRPGGYLVMAIPNENLLFKIVWFLWLRSNGKVWEDVHVHDFKKEGFAIFEQFGFRKIFEKKVIMNMWHFVIFQIS